MILVLPKFLINVLFLFFQGIIKSLKLCNSYWDYYIKVYSTFSLGKNCLQVDIKKKIFQNFVLSVRKFKPKPQDEKLGFTAVIHKINWYVKSSKCHSACHLSQPMFHLTCLDISLFLCN